MFFRFMLIHKMKQDVVFDASNIVTFTRIILIFISAYLLISDNTKYKGTILYGSIGGLLSLLKNRVYNKFVNYKIDN